MSFFERTECVPAKAGYCDHTEYTCQCCICCRESFVDSLDMTVIVFGVLERRETREVSIEYKGFSPAGAVLIWRFVRRQVEYPFISGAAGQTVGESMKAQCCDFAVLLDRADCK